MASLSLSLFCLGTTKLLSSAFCPTYTVKNGTLAVGGCDGHLAIEKSYDQAFKLITRGRDVIQNKLMRPRTGTPAQEKAYDRNATYLYDMFAVVLNPITGLVVPPAPGFRRNGAVHLQRVLGQYEDPQRLHYHK